MMIFQHSPYYREKKSKYIGKGPCPKCGSKDNLAVYDDHVYCFGMDCGYHSSDPEQRVEEQELRKPRMNSKLSTGVYHRIKDRGISEETCRFYGTQVIPKKEGDKTTIGGYIFPYFDLQGETHVGNIVRSLGKAKPEQFTHEGDFHNTGLFGQHLFPKGCAKAITITEGHEDCLAAFQMQGSKYPVLSIRNGAASATKCIKRSLEYVESFEKVYICFDSDDPGRSAALSVAHLLSPGKAKIVRLDPKLKDANGYLVANEQEAFVKAWWSAEQYVPGGFIASSSLKDRLRNRPTPVTFSYPWEGLNKTTYGLRLKELVLISAPQKVGKTSICREIEYHLLKHYPDLKLGTLFLEESPEDSALGLVSLNGSIPFHLPDAQYTPRDYTEAERILDDDRVIFYDHRGERSFESIEARIRYLAKGLDCKVIFVDNLSIMTSDHSFGDERKLLDAITTRFVQLKDQLDIALVVVVHLNREGKVFGSGAPEKFCNIHIRLDRDKINPDPKVRNTVSLTVMDNRFSGDTGPACSLRYNRITGRLEELDEFVNLEEFYKEERKLNA